MIIIIIITSSRVLTELQYIIGTLISISIPLRIKFFIYLFVVINYLTTHGEFRYPSHPVESYTTEDVHYYKAMTTL